MSLKFENKLKLVTKRSLQLLPLAAIMFFNTSKGSAQGLGNSPYSAIGIGDVQGEAFASNIGTGNAGVASSNGMQINNLNPALWVRNRFTTFEFGGVGQYKEVRALGASQKDLGINIGFVALALPIKHYWTSGVVIKPHAYVDYSSSALGYIAGTNSPTVYGYKGRGALNKVSFTNAFQLGKYVSVGADLGYLFGNHENSSEVTVITDGTDNTVGLREKVNLKGLTARGGVALKFPIKSDNKLFLNVGGTYTLGSDVKSRSTSTYDLTKDSFLISLAPDTLYKDKSGSMDLPSEYRVGVSLEWPFMLTLSADYAHTDWNSFKNYKNVKSQQVANTNRYSFGAEYIPKMRSQRYFDLVAYRVGFNFGQSPYAPNGTQIDDKSVSLGLGLPMGSGANTLGLSFVGGERGVVAKNMLRERYLRVVMSLTFSDRWFTKPALD